MYTFHAPAEVFLEFFKRVKDAGTIPQEERIKILIGMVKEGYKISIMKSNKTPEQWVKDYSRHGKVLWVKPDTMEGGIENGNTNGL